LDANWTAPSAGRTISHAEWVRFQDANVVNTRASHGADVSLAWMRFMRENEPSGNVATQRPIAVHGIGFSAD
jgi:hypothetical protein